MAGQKTISSFFKPTTISKRSISESDEMLSPKQQKVFHLEDHSNFDPVPLDQKQSIEDKKLLAKIRLQSKKTPALSANIGPSWFKALESEFTKEYFQKLSNFLQQERKKYTVYPPEDQVYSWTRMCPINQVKVVILGQDPYHGPNQAHGLAFSVQNGIQPPPSLVNMYKELNADIEGFEIPKHGNLSGWAKQGVLLLNACLSVRAHNANSHKDQGWEQLTDAVIRRLNSDLKGVVFLLWGSYAQKKGAFINKKEHLVLQCPHPSPLSATRGFFGCRHFSKANNYLEKMSKKPINWNNLTIEEEFVSPSFG